MTRRDDRTSALITTQSVHSLTSLETSLDFIYFYNLPPLASNIVREQLYIRGYLKRPDHQNRLIHWLQSTFIPWLLNILYNCRPNKVKAVLVSSTTPQHPSPKVLGRRAGLTVAEALKSVNVDHIRTPTTHSHTDQSIYWSCKSHPGSPDPSASPLFQESPLSVSLSCDLPESSYITSYTTPPISPDLARLEQKNKNILGSSMSSIAEAALWSLAPRVSMMNVKRSYLEKGTRSFWRLRYGKVCHNHLV